MAELKHAGEHLLRRFAARDSAPDNGDSPEGMTREHQSNAQAFALTLIYKDGRRKRTLSWQMYADHEWTDDGDIETIVAFFSERVCVIHGFRLKALDRDMSLGKRASIREHTKAQVESMLGGEGDEPIIVSIEVFPGTLEMLAELKGENDDKRHHAGRAKG
jgi:hypothetical protein